MRWYHSSQCPTIRTLSHQSTHETSPPHLESPKWNQRQHHHHTLHKQWRSTSSQIHQHHKSSKAKSKCHWLGGKWIPTNVRKLALGPHCEQEVQWQCTSTMSTMTPFVKWDAGDLTHSSCTSTSRLHHSLLAYPRRCLLKSDGTSNIEGPTVVDEPAAAAAAAA